MSQWPKDTRTMMPTEDPDYLKAFHLIIPSENLMIWPLTSPRSHVYPNLFPGFLRPRTSSLNVIGSVNESNAEHYAVLLDVHGFVAYFADPRPSRLVRLMHSVARVSSDPSLIMVLIVASIPASGAKVHVASPGRAPPAGFSTTFALPAKFLNPAALTAASAGAGAM